MKIIQNNENKLLKTCIWNIIKIIYKNIHGRYLTYILDEDRS